ncbi:hypothetical protein F5Y02DRAFT_376700 [Annulohypoxylon stygium]|nr:hypothetical protein F5Y02DRAFT_376700 [Annulohypoxylon stygium]
MGRLVSCVVMNFLCLVEGVIKVLTLNEWWKLKIFRLFNVILFFSTYMSNTKVCKKHKNICKQKRSSIDHS